MEKAILRKDTKKNHHKLNVFFTQSHERNDTYKLNVIPHEIWHDKFNEVNSFLVIQSSNEANL